MRQLLEQLMELYEATYQADLVYRNRANDFVESLVKFVKEHSDLLVQNRDGYSVLSDLFWKDMGAHGIYVLFLPKGFHGSNVKASIGDYRGKKTILLYLLNAPNDLSNLVDRISFSASIIVHEMIHILDPGYNKGKNPNPEDAKDYYNNPSEWNSFWQEGAFNVERTANNPILDTKERWGKVLGLTFRDFQDKSIKLWDKNFIANMNRDTRKKFDKRLYQLWLEVSKKIPEN